jgi:hypothetical protein
LLTLYTTAPGRPEGYLAGPLITKEFAAETEDYPDDMLVYTQVPSQDLGTKFSDVEGGWTECLIRGSTKRAILKTPGFPQAPLKLPRLVYCLGPTSMGVGMFATKDLSMGDHILSERPLTVSPIGIRVPVGIGHSGNLSPEQLRQAMLFEWEKLLEICFNRLEPDNQAAFMALANSHTKDGSGPILGVIRTNGFEVDGLQDSIPEGSYAAVCKIMSRINHRFVVISSIDCQRAKGCYSCSPSADRLFDIPSFSFQLRATRNIKKGEEIFVSYCDVLEEAAHRQAYLAPYGIVCTCTSCTPDTTESDKRRLGLKESIAAIEDDFDNWVADPLLADDKTIRTSLGWLEAIKKEALEASDAYRHHVYAIVRAYVALGDADNAVKYGEQLGLWYRGQSGKDDTLKLMVDPEYHKARPAWRVRVCADHDNTAAD